MFFWYKLSVYLHILSAMFWIGGMIFTALVLVPITRNKLIIPQKGAFFSVMGKKFSRISWLLFVLLMLTGYMQLQHRGYDGEILLQIQFWHSHFGAILASKLLVFSAVLILSGLHDFWLGPAAARHMDVYPDALKTTVYRKITAWAGRLNLLLGMVILYYAISLVRG